MMCRPVRSNGPSPIRIGLPMIVTAGLIPTALAQSSQLSIANIFGHALLPNIRAI